MMSNAKAFIAFVVPISMMLVTSAQSATIELTTSEGYLDADNAVGAANADNKTIDTLATGQSSALAHASVDHSDSFDGSAYSNVGDAYASVDAVTGTLRTSVNQSYEGYFGQGAAGGSAIAKVYETFTASGTGTVTAYMKIDGSYSVSTKSVVFPGDGSVIPAPDIGFQLTGSISLGNGTGGPYDIENLDDPGNCYCGGRTSASGLIDDLLSVSLDVADGQTFDFMAQLITQMFSGEGILDFGHTGLLALTTTPGLTLLPSDPLFLSNPTLATTPVPAALPLFASALGTLGCFGWRRRKRCSVGG
jgi:hypothetical protein